MFSLPVSNAKLQQIHGTKILHSTVICTQRLVNGLTFVREA